jgi:hypothetical protein
MRPDGKTAKTVYTGNGVKSIEWIDPPKKGAPKPTEPKRSESKTDKADKD